MNGDGNWLLNLGKPNDSSAVDGLIPVKGYREELQPRTICRIDEGEGLRAQGSTLRGRT